MLVQWLYTKIKNFFLEIALRWDSHRKHLTVISTARLDEIPIGDSKKILDGKKVLNINEQLAATTSHQH